MGQGERKGSAPKCILKSQEGDTPSPLGSILKTVITLAGPNTVRVVSKDKKAGITDTQIYRFTLAGGQVQTKLIWEYLKIQKKQQSNT